MMSINTMKSEKGFTFIELIYCFAILLMLVVPISFKFVQGINQRLLAKSIEQATSYGETMLEDVKVQITNDIKLRNEILGNKKPIVSASDEKGVSDYLVGSYNKPARQLTDFLKSRDNESINKSYDTDKFTYEVGIWNMDDLNVSDTGNMFILNDITLNKSARFYTDINYQFNPESYKDMNIDVTFGVEDLDVFNKTKLPDYILHKNIVEFPLSDVGGNKKQIDGVDDVFITGTSDKIKVTCESILSTYQSEESGFVFKISEGNFIAPQDKNKTGVIEIDVRNLQRELNSGNTGDSYSHIDEYRELSFKIINETNINHIIKLKKNIVSGESEYENNNLFNIVIEDRADGKTSIAKTGDNEYQQDYLITVIIREKSPVQGQPGKIVKKMIDIYSYDITNN